MHVDWRHDNGLPGPVQHDVEQEKEPEQPHLFGFTIRLWCQRVKFRHFYHVNTTVPLAF